jgi:aminopeptidase N
VAPADLAEVLRGLLDGNQLPAGLAVDTELRWSLVQALVVLGGLDEAAIEAELACDNTARGALHALTARASRPDAAAKEQAWRSVTRDAALSNHESDAVAAGFWQFGQDELLRDYVNRYAAELPALWGTRTPQVAGRLTVRLFPSTVVDPLVLEVTVGLLDEAYPAGLRRYVAEQRDDLARALRARGA